MNSTPDFKNLETVAQSLVNSGKGLLAADESTGTIEKRFQSVGVTSTEETRRDYRELLFTTPGLGEFISGVILFDETLRQKARDGTPLVEVLARQGIMAGIKVDKSAKPLANFPGDKITEGLDGLPARLAEYAKLGARFTKWRGVISIGPDKPSATCLESNAEALARFAACSQAAGLVPIVEPEVLMDGAHSIERHFEVTRRIQGLVFTALARHRVHLEGMLLKPNMVLSGQDAAPQASRSEVAEMTLRCLSETVPPAVPGIIFLSGGQSPVQATENLNALNQSKTPPWALSFSYGRALQEPVLQAWKGRNEAVPQSQQALHHRARCNSLARFGRYNAEME